jgi:hypothetical protein
MKVAVISCDARGMNDPTVNHQIVRHLDTVPVSQADVVIAFLSFREDYEISGELMKLRKPWVLIDFVEDDRKWNGEENRLGFERPYFRKRETADWVVLNHLVEERPPILTFKRELMWSRVSERCVPIDYLAEQKIPKVQTRAQYEHRQFQVFFTWGLSNPQRPRLHAKMFDAYARHELEVFDAPENVWDTYLPQQWVSIYAPWWARLPMKQVMEMQQNAKISVSLPGAGKKCFRCAEAPVGCLPAFGDFPIARAYPWDASNSVVLTKDKEIECLKEALATDLYERYVLAQENIRRYEPKTYVRDHILANIARVL